VPTVVHCRAELFAPCTRDGIRAATDTNWPKYARRIADAVQDYAVTSPEGAAAALKSTTAERTTAAKLADSPLMTKLSTVCADWLKVRTATNACATTMLCSV
jgi:hypothetical protein